MQKCYSKHFMRQEILHHNITATQTRKNKNQRPDEEQERVLIWNAFKDAKLPGAKDLFK